MIEFLVANWDSIFLAATSVVTAASIIVKLTPTKRDDEAMGKIMGFVNLIALNKKPK